MANPSTSVSSMPQLLVIFIISMITLLSAVDAGSSIDQELGWVSTTKPTTTSCQGTIAECEAFGEFDMDSEISRRILATTQYISYQALRRNTVPCSQTGASYYNCKPGAQANPYDRGCTAITRCKS